MDLTDKETLIRFLKKYNLWAKKELGQNFLIDRQALDDFVFSAEIAKDDTILEIGPGPGVLTRELLKRAKRVIAIEKDKRAIELLKKTTAEFSNLDIVEGDVLALRIKEKDYKLVASLPFYISSPIFRRFLEAENKPKLISVLVQKEVAEKIVAGPGEMNILTISVQFYGKPEIVRTVPKTSFLPVPKVDAAVIKILPYEKPIFEVDSKSFFRVVKAGFGEKRKKLVNSLSGGLQIDKSIIADILAKEGINQDARAEDLSLDLWHRLYEGLKSVL